MMQSEMETICKENEEKKNKRKIRESIEGKEKEIEPDFKEDSVETKKTMGIVAKDGGEPIKRRIPKRLVFKSAKRVEFFIKQPRHLPENQRYFCGHTFNLTKNGVALAAYSSKLPRNIPPHDSTASTPEKAYPLDQVIFKEHLGKGFVLYILKLVQSGAEISPDVYPSFVRNRVHKLLEIEDEEERKKLACIFSYITFLIEFKDQQNLDSTSLKKHRIPVFVFSPFLAMFADVEKYSPSDEKRDLLISYVLVLTLFADGYCTDISDIARDLKMTVMLLKEYYLNLGCKVKQEDKSVICTLSAPLEFPYEE